MPCPALGVKKGDAVSASVAAASIVAKVTRDRIMVRLDRRYPAFGFWHNKGYGTPGHWAALEAHGPYPGAPTEFPRGGPGGLAGLRSRGRRLGVRRWPTMEDDIERFEEERELELYREYRDVLPMFGYVIETERRFYLANKVELQPLEEGWVQVRLTDAWVWDMFRPARFVSSVQVMTRRDVNVEELRRDETAIPDAPEVGPGLSN